MVGNTCCSMSDVTPLNEIAAWFDKAWKMVLTAASAESGCCPISCLLCSASGGVWSGRGWLDVLLDADEFVERDCDCGHQGRGARLARRSCVEHGIDRRRSEQRRAAARKGGRGRVASQLVLA